MEELLQDQSRGGYRFLPGIDPYSCGVIAAAGWEIVHARLKRPLPWYEGLVRVRQYLEGLGRERHALCGVELRCPRPHTMEGFIEFNQKYCALLDDWDMILDDCNPLARTNVAPIEQAPHETQLHGFSYTEPSEHGQQTFVVAGAGELIDGTLDETGIVRSGETSESALLEKARYVVDVMRERMRGLGAELDSLSSIDVYTAHPLKRILADVIAPGLPLAAQIGVNWFYSRPPVEDIEFEMDMRGVRRDLVVDLQT